MDAALAEFVEQGKVSGMSIVEAKVLYDLYCEVLPGIVKEI